MAKVTWLNWAGALSQNSMWRFYTPQTVLLLLSTMWSLALMKSLLKLMFPLIAWAHLLCINISFPFNNLLCHIQLGKNYMLVSRLYGGNFPQLFFLGWNCVWASNFLSLMRKCAFPWKRKMLHPETTTPSHSSNPGCLLLWKISQVTLSHLYSIVLLHAAPLKLRFLNWVHICHA